MPLALQDDPLANIECPKVRESYAIPDVEVGSVSGSFFCG